MNGPAGVFELDEFAVGTQELLRAFGETEAFTVVGGGHTIAAVDQMGFRAAIDHVSTGGGSLIHFLSGKELPLVNALRRSYAKFSRTTASERQR